MLTDDYLRHGPDAMPVDDVVRQFRAVGIQADPGALVRIGVLRARYAADGSMLIDVSDVVDYLHEAFCPLHAHAADEAIAWDAWRLAS